MKIAFLGAGIMGGPMARNLKRAGHDVIAWNRSREKADALRDSGIAIADTPGDAAAGAHCALLMLSTGPVCDQILFGAHGTEETGVAHALPRGAIVLVMSSIPVETARIQAKRLAELGIGYVDAPVSGGERGAKEASLSIMAGGGDGEISRLQSVFSAMGRLTHVGPVGAGQLAKLANQLIVGVTIGAVAEALLLAEAGGANPAAVREAIIGGFADSTILKQHGERMLARNFTPGARAEVQLKDLRTALGQAAAEGCDLPFLALAERLYAEMCAGARADLDHSALYLELMERGTRSQEKSHA